MIIQEHQEEKLIHIQFDSLDEQTEQVEKQSTLIKSNQHFRELSTNSEWIGRTFYSLEESLKAIRKPWPEGFKKYEDMLDELRNEHLPEPVSIRRTRMWSEEDGNEVSLDRLKVGLPYWETSHRVHRPGPATVTIVTNIGARAMISHENILWRGAASICLTELLERAGYRVELQIANLVKEVFGYSGPKYFLGSTCLKRTNEPLDVTTIVNAVSGWCFRTLFFASRHLTRYRIQGLEYGASQYSFEPKILSHITPDEKVLYSEACFDRESSIAWIKKQLTILEEQSFSERSV